MLDVSASISSDTYSRIGGTLAALSRSGGRFGLVVFSDEAYAALPPGVPAADLAPFVRYFTLPQQVRPGFAVTFPPNPWQATFSGGTRISAGMDLAHSIAVASPHHATVVLVSDLDDNPGDLTRLATVLLSYRRDGVPVRIVGLNPSPDDLAFFQRLLPPGLGDRRGADAVAGAAARPHAVPVGARRARASRSGRGRAALGLGAAARLEEQVSGIRLALAALLVAAAVLVALLAADVRSWPAALASGDAVYAATPGRASWTPSTRLGGFAEGLLGVRTEVAGRRALQLYTLASGLHERLDNALDVQTARAQAQDALASAARDPNPQRAAQARTLLGILTFGASATGGSQDQVDAADVRLHRRDPSRSRR